MRRAIVIAIAFLSYANLAIPAAAQSRFPAAEYRKLAGHNIDARLLQPVASDRNPQREGLRRPPAPNRGETNRGRSAVIGGIIGSVAGVVVCTGISSLTNDSADGGFSTCTTKGNLLFATGGFAVGAAVGVVVHALK